jgi:hypothetical protein
MPTSSASTVRLPHRRVPAPAALMLALALLVALLPIVGAVATARQDEVPVVSPATGHASVIAQGLAALPPGDLAWRVTYRSTRDGGAEAGDDDAGPGFVAVEQGAVVTGTGEGAALLAPGEAAFAPAGGRDIAQDGAASAAWFDLEVVPAGRAGADVGGLAVYAGAPFPAPEGGDPRDLGLVRDVLQPEESTTIAGQAAPTLVLVTQGELRVVSADGSSAELAVGQAGAFSGGLTVTGGGTAASSFLAAVVGASAAVSGGAAATPEAGTPVGEGVVEVVVFSCPADVRPRRASADTCRVEPGAIDLRLAALDGDAARDLGAPAAADDRAVWDGLATGAYVLRAAGFADGYDRLFVPGLETIGADGADGIPAGDEGGFQVDLTTDAPSARLEAYALAGADSGGGTGGAIRVAGGDEADPARTPRPDRTPDPERTPRADRGQEVDAVGASTPVTTSAVARARRGSITVRVFSCPDPFASFDAARCAVADEPYEVSLTGEDGTVRTLADAREDGEGVWIWEDLPFDRYVLLQPVLAPGVAAYYLPDAQLAADGIGYELRIDAETPRLETDLFGLASEGGAGAAGAAGGDDRAERRATRGSPDGGPAADGAAGAPAAAAPAAAPAEPAAPAAPSAGVDTDGDSLTDDFEVNVAGTDPAVFDSDGDGVGDGDDVLGAAPAPGGTAPPADGAGQAPPADGGGQAPPADGGQPTGGVDGDGDGDGLTDAQEAEQGTSPSVADSDADGFSDGAEVNAGTSPRDSGQVPPG